MSTTKQCKHDSFKLNDAVLILEHENKIIYTSRKVCRFVHWSQCFLLIWFWSVCFKIVAVLNNETSVTLWHLICVSKIDMLYHKFFDIAVLGLSGFIPICNCNVCKCREIFCGKYFTWESSPPVAVQTGYRCRYFSFLCVIEIIETKKIDSLSLMH